MLVLLSFGLVLVATVLLVLGLLVGEGLSLIYGSIALSALAAVLLVIAVRVSKPKVAAPVAPAPIEPEGAAGREPATVGAPAAAVGAEAPAAPSGAPASTTAPTPTVPPPTAAAPAAAGNGDEWLASDQDWQAEDEWAEGEEVEFPIADYDDLTEEELLPLLPQLYSDELDVVQARERATKERPSILARLAELRETGTEADAEAAAGDALVAPAAPAAGEGWAPTEPIPDYDSLAVSEVIASLGRLDDAQLRQIRQREASGKNRRTVLAAIDRRLGEAAPAAPAAAAQAPARKAAAKKAPAKKAAAKKAAPAHRGPYGRGSAAPGPRGGQPVGYPIKGNEQSRIYHVPGSAAYSRTRAEVFFATEDDARRAGFKPAGTTGPAKKAGARKAAAAKKATKKRR